MTIELFDSAFAVIFFPAVRPPAVTPKQPAPLALNSLDEFIQARCEVSRSAKQLFKTFCAGFWNWLSANERPAWSKRHIRNELMARGYVVMAGTGNKRYVHGLTLPIDRPTTSPEPIPKRKPAPDILDDFLAAEYRPSPGASLRFRGIWRDFADTLCKHNCAEEWTYNRLRRELGERGYVFGRDFGEVTIHGLRRANDPTIPDGAHNPGPGWQGAGISPLSRLQARGRN